MGDKRVTSWRERRLTIGGRPVDAILEGQRDALVARMKARFVLELPAYSQLAPDEIAGWVTTTGNQFIDLVAHSLRDRLLPGEDELLMVRSTAARRAALGIPMGEVISAFSIGTSVVTEAIAREAGPDESDVVVALHAFALEFLGLIASVVGTGYSLERQSMIGDEVAARQALVADLLAGTVTADAAARAGIALPKAYLVVAFQLTDVTGGQEGERIALRRIREETTRLAPGTVLWEPVRAGWVALVPYAAELAELPVDDRLWLGRTHRDVQTATGSPVHAAWAVAPPEGVPTAVTLAREVLDVVLMTHRPAGAYGLDDILIDYQLMRPSHARDRLARLLDPIAGRPELIVTLRTYFEVGRDRRRTAQVLHLHPNSVDNRLRRIADLTGLDATGAEDLLLLRAALLGSSSA